MVHRSRRLLAGNFGAARWVLIRAVHRFYVKYVNAMGAGVMFWWVVTSGRSVVQRSRRLFVGNFGVARRDLIRALSRLCVKCADTVGAGSCLKQERFTSLWFCFGGS